MCTILVHVTRVLLYETAPYPETDTRYTLVKIVTQHMVPLIYHNLSFLKFRLHSEHMDSHVDFGGDSNEKQRWTENRLLLLLQYFELGGVHDGVGV